MICQHLFEGLEVPRLAENQYILAALISLVLPAKLGPGLAGAAEAPKTWESLWADYDPRQESLDAEVVREWEVGGVVFRYVTYHIGTFKDVPARMAVFYAFPQRPMERRRAVLPKLAMGINS
ncbi:MAG: hypothetical protein ACYC6Y_06905 [Thermoguttaceae bacterium]